MVWVEGGLSLVGGEECSTPVSPHIQRANTQNSAVACETLTQTIRHPHTLFSAGLVLVNSAGKVEPGYVAPEKTYSDVAQSGSPLLSPTLINLVSSVRGLAKGWGKGTVLDNRIDVLDILMKRVSCPSHSRGSSGCSRGTSSGS